LKSQRKTDPLRRPERICSISSLKGLPAPSWVEITRTRPPQIKSARAALISSPSLSWNAASSMTTTPCLPRRLAGRDDRATIRRPEPGKRMV